MVPKISLKPTMFYQLKSSMLTFTWIEILKIRSSKPMSKKESDLKYKGNKEKYRRDKSVRAIVGNSIVNDVNSSYLDRSYITKIKKLS